MNFTMPDRNILIGSLAAVIVWAMSVIAEKYGVAFSNDVMIAMPTIVGFVIAHFIPLSTGELVKKLDDDVVHAAQVDPKSNVSYVIPPVAVPPGEAPTIVPPASKDGT